MVPACSLARRRSRLAPFRYDSGSRVARWLAGGHDWHHSGTIPGPGLLADSPAAMIGIIMVEPIRGPSAQKIGAAALAGLLARCPAAEGPLYRLLAARISRLTDAGELAAGGRLPAERCPAARASGGRDTGGGRQ